MSVAFTPTGNLTAPSVISGASIDRQANQDFGAGSTMSLVFNTEATVVPGKNDVAIATTVVSGSAFVFGSHGLTGGSPVVLRTTALDPVLGNFTGGTTYYVVRADSGNIALASTFANSLTTATAIVTATTSSLNLTTLPTLEFQIITAEDAALTKSVRVAGSSGPIPVNVPRQISIDSSVGVETAGVVLAAADQYETGTAIVFTFTGGTISPLISGAVYYVTLPTTAGFKVATSYVNALAGIFLDLGTPSGITTPITVKVADNMLVLAGPQIFVDFNPRAMGPNVGQQYIGARIVPSLPLSAGSFSAKFTMDVDSAVGGRGVRAYTSGYTI
jgi:hypothetical protein